MTEREVSSERVSEERLLEIIEWAKRYGEDARESCNVHEMWDMASELLALRSSVKTVGLTGEEPEAWRLDAPDGASFLFNVEDNARSYAEATGGKVVPLYTRPSPVAPSEVTEEQVERAMKSFALIAHDMTPEAYDEDRAEAAKRPITQKRVQKSLDAMRAALTSALKGDRP